MRKHTHSQLMRKRITPLRSETYELAYPRQLNGLPLLLMLSMKPLRVRTNKGKQTVRFGTPALIADARNKWRVYLAHALLEVGGEAASDDGAAAVHAVDDVGGDSGVRLPEDVGRALVPPSSPGPAGGPVLGAGVVAGDARGPEAELLLLGVDAAVEA